MIDLDSAILYSKDISRIIDFYQNKLGFKLEYNENDYFVSFIFPSGKKLGIRQEKGERERAGHQTVFFAVSDIKKEFEDRIKTPVHRLHPQNIHRNGPGASQKNR